MLEQNKENKAWKIISIILNCIFYLFIALLLIFSISNLKMKDEFSIPGIFGKGYLTVQSESMTGNNKDSFTQNDMIFVDVVNDKNRDKKTKNLSVGDIITFVHYNNLDGKTMLNTHRIVDTTINTKGELCYITQGDYIASFEDKKYEKNPDLATKHPEYTKFYETVSYKDVKGIYTGKWTGAGKSMKFLQSPNGFLLCIVIPTALFFIFEAIMLVLNFTKIKSHKKDVATAEAHEEEMANMKAELEAQVRAQVLAEMESKKENESLEETKEDNNEETKE